MKYVHAGVAFAIIVTWSSSVTMAEAYTFIPSSGAWDTIGNWLANGGGTANIPGANDVAIVSAGKTCHIVNRNEAALSMTVNGLLAITDKTLTLGSSSSSTTTTLGGVIQFADGYSSSATVPRIVVYNNTTITNGKIETTFSQAGHTGEITWASASTDTVKFDGAINLHGSLYFNMNVTFLNGGANCLCGGSINHMYFGPASGNTYTVSGSAGLISAGTGGDVTFRRVHINGLAASLVLTGEGSSNVSVGKLESACTANTSSCTVTVNHDALLDVETNFAVLDLAWGGVNSTIDVAPGKVFKADP